MLDALFERFDALLVLDTETTGFSCRRDEIIELAAMRVIKRGGALETEAQMDALIRLSEGRRLPPAIRDLTGITDEMLQSGAQKREAAEQFAAMLTPGTLIVAYNAQFDLSFLYFFLLPLGLEDGLRHVARLDAMTVYKDRRPYPHRLANAVDAYRLQTQNTHRAIDDAAATLELLGAMERERDDLARYIDLFGYNPKYGAPRPRIRTVTYRPQPYDSALPLYELPDAEA